jgi:hypothetical protein
VTPRRGGRGGHPPQQFQDRVFGRLLVTGQVPPAPGGRPGSYWACLCSCGERPLKHGADLRSGRVLSCGCLRRETSAANGRRRLGLKRNGGREPTAALG